jgi:hypothetical protein
MALGLAIADSGSWGGGAGTATLTTGGSWSTGSGGGSNATTSYSAPAPSYAPAVFNSRGAFGEGVFTPLDYPPMRFLGSGDGLFDDENTTRRSSVSKADQLIILALIAVVLLKG